MLRKRTQQSYATMHNVHRITLYNTVAAAHQHRIHRPRLYLHLDMNCFYAQVEQQSFNLYGIPVIIGGWRKANGMLKGIVATCSYEARKLGIRTAMSAFEAQQLCPYVVSLQIHYEKYRAISRQIRSVLEEISPDVEAYSMDEYFLDVSHWRMLSPSDIAWKAQRVKDELYRITGLLCSVGVARSKTYAKLASDMRKPNGLMLLLTEDEERTKVHPLPASDVWGVGPKRAEAMREAGLVTIADVLKRGPYPLQQLFGEYFGKMLFETIAGRDQARIMADLERIPKEVSYMHTFPGGTVSVDDILAEIGKAIHQLAYRMRGYGRKARAFQCQLRFEAATWKGVSFDFRTEGYTNLDDYIRVPCERRARPLLTRLLEQGHTVRGVGMATLGLTDMRQTDLFFAQEERLERRYEAVDSINNRHGRELVRPGAVLAGVKGKVHFLER
jgi:DNA polymerase-4